MTGQCQWWSDDDQLLVALGDALRAARAVPPEVVEAGKAVFTWRDIDAELAAFTHAALVYDSALEEDHAPVVLRSGPAPFRVLTFASPELTIELEVTPEALLGQIVPTRPGERGGGTPGEMEVCAASGDVVTAAVDEAGCFVVRPVPAGPFRLRCHTAAGAGVLTSWISP